MTSRAGASSSRRATGSNQPPQAADADAFPQSPPPIRNKRQSMAAAVQQIQQQDHDEREAGIEMQVAANGDNSVALSRLQTMSVVTKLNKSATRSRLEGRVLLTQKLAIFFAVSGIALGIIEQETLWYVIARMACFLQLPPHRTVSSSRHAAPLSPLPPGMFHIKLRKSAPKTFHATVASISPRAPISPSSAP